MPPFWPRIVSTAVVAIYIVFNLKQNLNTFLTQEQSNETTGASQEEHRHLRTTPAINTPPSSQPTTVPVASHQPVQISNISLANAQASTASIISLANAEASTSSDYAYAFFLAGVTINDENTQTNKDGFLYNIMVSTQILKESGSTADFVLLVHTVEPNIALPPAKASMLQKMGIRIRYTHHTGLDSTNYFGSIALEKFQIFSWSEYARILVMDADIMPHCNLDYLFQKSADGTLQENVLVSMGDQPASPSFFLIKPVKGRFDRFRHMIAHIPSQSQQKNLLFSPTGEWISLKRMEDGLGIQTEWDFDGLESDAGLLYAFMRFRLRKDTSVIVGDQVYNLAGGKSQLIGELTKSPIQGLSCPKHLDEGAIEDSTHQASRQRSSSADIAPYRDIAFWSGHEVQPWNIVDHTTKLAGATEQWFKVLTSLNQQHQFGIGLERGIFQEEQQQSQSSNLVPVAGMSHQALKDWARHKQEQSTPETHGDATPSQLYAKQPKAGNSTKRAFVCVTGQFERLELRNKIKKLLQPIKQKGYQVDLALVVTSGQTTYTNSKSVSRAPFYLRFSRALQLLEAKGINVLTSEAYARIDNPPFNEAYFKRLHKHQQGKRSEESQKERVLNHARIFDSYTRCWDHAKHAVQEAHGSMDDYYDVFFRIRDDVGFEEELPEPVLSSLLQPSPGSVQVTGCRGWHGMNDRFASVSPSIAETYFTVLHQNYISGQVQDGVTMVYNPETFLMSTFAHEGIRVLANRELRGVFKVIKDQNRKTIFAPDDLEKRLCVEGNPHVKHLIDLYGWSF